MFRILYIIKAEVCKRWSEYLKELISDDDMTYRRI